MFLYDMPSSTTVSPSFVQYPIEHRLHFSILFKIYTLLERGANGEFLAQGRQKVSRQLDDFFYGNWKTKEEMLAAFNALNAKQEVYGCILDVAGLPRVHIVVDIAVFDGFLKRYLSALESHNFLAMPDIAQPDQKEKAECYKVHAWSKQVGVFHDLLEKQYEAPGIPLTLIRFHLFGRSEEGRYHPFCFEELLIHSERRGYLHITSWNTKEDPDEKNYVSLMVNAVYSAVIVFGPWKYNRINDSISFRDKLLFELKTASKTKGPSREFFFLKLLLEKDGGPIETHELKRAVHQEASAFTKGDFKIADVKRSLVRAFKAIEPFIEGRRRGSPGYRLLSQPKVIPKS